MLADAGLSDIEPAGPLDPSIEEPQEPAAAAVDPLDPAIYADDGDGMADIYLDPFEALDLAEPLGEPSLPTPPVERPAPARSIRPTPVEPMEAPASFSTKPAELLIVPDLEPEPAGLPDALDLSAIGERLAPEDDELSYEAPAVRVPGSGRGSWLDEVDELDAPPQTSYAFEAPRPRHARPSRRSERRAATTQLLEPETVLERAHAHERVAGTRSSGLTGALGHRGKLIALVVAALLIVAVLVARSGNDTPQADAATAPRSATPATIAPAAPLTARPRGGSASRAAAPKAKALARSAKTPRRRVVSRAQVRRTPTAAPARQAAPHRAAQVFPSASAPIPPRRAPAPAHLVSPPTRAAVSGPVVPTAAARPSAPVAPERAGSSVPEPADPNGSSSSVSSEFRR